METRFQERRAETVHRCAAGWNLREEGQWFVGGRQHPAAGGVARNVREGTVETVTGSSGGAEEARAVAKSRPCHGPQL